MCADPREREREREITMLLASCIRAFFVRLSVPRLLTQLCRAKACNLLLLLLRSVARVYHFEHASQCDTRMLDGSLFVLVLQTRPGHVLNSLSHRDLLSLAGTCQACKQVICVLLLPQAQDVSAGQETNAVPCPTSLSTVSRAISFCRANDLPL